MKIKRYNSYIPPNVSICNHPDTGLPIKINEPDDPKDVKLIEAGGQTFVRTDDPNSMQGYTFYYNKGERTVTINVGPEDRINAVLTSDISINAFIEDSNECTDVINKKVIDPGDVDFIEEDPEDTEAPYNNPPVETQPESNLAKIPLKGKVEISRSLENHPEGSISPIIKQSQKGIFKKVFKPGKELILAGIPFIVDSYNIRPLANNESPVREYECSVKLVGKWSKYIDKPVKLTNKPTSSIQAATANKNYIDPECVITKESVEQALDNQNTFTKISLPPLIKKDTSVTVSGIPVYYKVSRREEIDTYITDWLGITREQARIYSSFITLSEPSGIIVKPIGNSRSINVHEIDILEDQGTTVYTEESNDDPITEEEIEEEKITDKELDRLRDEDVDNEQNEGFDYICEDKETDYTVIPTTLNFGSNKYTLDKDNTQISIIRGGKYDIPLNVTVLIKPLTTTMSGGIINTVMLPNVEEHFFDIPEAINYSKTVREKFLIEIAAISGVTLQKPSNALVYIKPILEEPDPDNPEAENPTEKEPEDDEDEEDESASIPETPKYSTIEITGDFTNNNPAYEAGDTEITQSKTLPIPMWKRKPPVTITVKEGDVNANQPPIGTATGECETWDLSLNFDMGGPTKMVRESTTINGSPYMEKTWVYGFAYLAADMAGIDKDGYPVGKKGYYPFWTLIKYEQTVHEYHDRTGYYLGYITTSDELRRFKQEDSGNPESIWTALEGYRINQQIEAEVVYDKDGNDRPITQDDRDLFDRDRRWHQAIKDSIKFRNMASRTVNKLQIIDYGSFYQDAAFTDNLVPYKVCLPNGGSVTQFAVDPSVIIPGFVIAESTESCSFASMENPENIIRKYEFDKDMEKQHPQPAFADSDKAFVPAPKLTTGSETFYFKELKIYPKGTDLTVPLGPTRDQDRYTEFISEYSAQDGQFIASAAKKTFKEYVGRPPEATRRDLGYERIDSAQSDQILENQPPKNGSSYESKVGNIIKVGSTECLASKNKIQQDMTDWRLFLSIGNTVDTKHPSIVSMGNSYAETPDEAIKAVLAQLYLDRVQSNSISTFTIPLNLNIKELDTVTVQRKKGSKLTGRVIAVKHVCDIGPYTMGDHINTGSYSTNDTTNKPIFKAPPNINREPIEPQVFLTAYTEITIGIPICTFYNVLLAPKNENVGNNGYSYNTNKYDKRK